MIDIAISIKYTALLTLSTRYYYYYYCYYSMCGPKMDQVYSLGYYISSNFMDCTDQMVLEPGYTVAQMRKTERI
jgi:hypothetical protein